MIRDRIRELVSIMESEGLDEIEVRKFLTTIRVARRRSGGVEVGRGGAGEPGTAEEEAPAVDSAPDGAVENVPAAVPDEDTAGGDEAFTADRSGLQKILSPMVGTCYMASGPEADPFVSPGQRVETGQVICIIEAMKLMNEIEAEVGGIIREVLVEDAQPVEFGQPLFLIESA